VTDLFDALFKSLPEALAVLGTLASILAGLSSLLLGQFARRKPAPSEAVPGSGRREETRIAEAVRELARQERANRWNRWISGVLTAGQYLVGAALASSFIQTAMSAQYVGILGLIVLFSQVIQQRFRPDLRAIGAKERVTILRRLIRDAEDDLYASETKRDGAPSLYDIRAIVSRGLAEVERHESEELTSRIRAQVEPPDGQRGTPNKGIEPTR
jgi:hypothetical protein